MALIASTRIRILTVAVSALVTGGLGWIALRNGEIGNEAVVLLDDSGAAERLLVERQSASRGSVSGADTSLLETRLVREPISRETASELFPIGSGHFIYDPHTFYAYEGGLDLRVEFPEHEGGFIKKRTSSEGFGEDFERLPAKRDRLVIVTGDSHTDGLCNNDESFANRLEALLEAHHLGLDIEVLNTGVTGYSFYNYLGVLEKLLPEKPDAFVVAFYGGNDFLDVLKPWHLFHHTALPPRRADYREKLDRARQGSGVAVANAFNQLLYFQYNPDQIELALAGAAQACGEIQRLCDQNKIQLTFVYIPPGFDIDGVLKPEFAQAKEVLALSNSDLQQFHRLADRLIGVLHERGAYVIDLRDQFIADIDDYYWADLHINLKGHQLIAELLLPRIEARCFDER